MFMIKPLKEALEESYTKIKEQEIAQLYASCYKTAWETTLVLEEMERVTFLRAISMPCGCGTARCSFFRI